MRELLSNPGTEDLQILPLTSERWTDLERLFGPGGACGGCWCMWWRLTRAQFNERKGEKNKQAFKEIVVSGEPTGVLAYTAGREPIGWCAIAPREAYTLLERSRTLRRVDEHPVWSAVCFFVAKQHRHRGVTLSLLKAALDYAARQGATIVEGYPLEAREGRIPDVWAYHGLTSAFRKAGFTEVLRRSKRQPIMRYYINPGSLESTP